MLKGFMLLATVAFLSTGSAIDAYAQSSNKSNGIDKALNTSLSDALNTPVITTNPAYGVLQQIDAGSPGPGFGPSVSGVATETGPSVSGIADQAGVSASSSSQGLSRSGGVGGFGGRH
jgi:hypothetical protein